MMKFPPYLVYLGGAVKVNFVQVYRICKQYSLKAIKSSKRWVICYMLCARTLP